VFDRSKATRSGWTAGAGAEWAFAPNWSAKVEYLYVKLENNGFIAPNLGSAFNRSNVPLDDNIVRVGANFHF
jgi:outer membrane immunogenic protein